MIFSGQYSWNLLFGNITRSLVLANWILKDLSQIKASLMNLSQTTPVLGKEVVWFTRLDQGVVYSFQKASDSWQKS